MNQDYWGIAVIILASMIMLLIFVKKAQIRRAFFAILVAQMFAWIFSLAFVYYGWLINPVRLFPNASDNNFLFAYLFHPTVFVIYYLHYPKHTKLITRIIFTITASAFSITVQALTEKYTNLVYFPKKPFLIFALILLIMVYTISRWYIDWFFLKMGFREGGDHSEA